MNQLVQKKPLLLLISIIPIISQLTSGVVIQNTDQSPDVLLIDPRCPVAAGCGDVISSCSAVPEGDTGLRWTRYQWRDLSSNDTSSFWCRGCEVCLTQCPDHTHCTWSTCSGGAQHQWVNNVWCPICPQCTNQNPRKCFDFSCQDVSSFCTETTETVEQRVSMGVDSYYCWGCPDCKERCPRFSCLSQENCTLGGAGRLYHPTNWYDNRLCPGCPECLSSSERLVGSQSHFVFVVSITLLVVTSCS